jgi:hypothetical protein
LEHGGRSKNFKIRLGLSGLPPEISSALKNITKETCSSFMGKTKVKVRLLSEDLLSENTLSQLKYLKETFDLFDWLDEAHARLDSDNNDLGVDMYEESHG